MENGRTGTNAAADIKVASSKKADSGSEKADSGSKKADSGKTFAKALSLLLSIALLLSLAACVGTEGGQSGSGDDTEQPIDGDTPPEGDAAPIEDGTAPTGDGDTSTDDTTEDGNTEGEDPGMDKTNDESPDDSASIEKPVDDHLNGDESVQNEETTRGDNDGDSSSTNNFHAVNTLSEYQKEFTYIDESGTKNIEEVAEILYEMLLQDAMTSNNELLFIAHDAELLEVSVVYEGMEDYRSDYFDDVFPLRSDTCWGSYCTFAVKSFSGTLWPYGSGGLDKIKIVSEYDTVEGEQGYIEDFSGYRYIFFETETNTYTLSKPQITP